MPKRLKDDQPYTITITVRGDEVFKAAVRELARTKGVTQGDLVREAIDKVFGAELENLLIFFARDLVSTDNIDDTPTTPKRQYSNHVNAKGGKS